jgi:RNA-binding protein YhbY
VFNTSIEKIAEEVAEKTNSRVYEVRGFTFTLIKEN